jgi:hypothetical protein
MAMGEQLDQYKRTKHVGTTFRQGDGEGVGYINKRQEEGEGDDTLRVHVPDGSAHYFGGRKGSTRRSSLILKAGSSNALKRGIPSNKGIHPEGEDEKVVRRDSTVQMMYSLTETFQDRFWFVLNPRNVFFDYWATLLMCTLLWVAMLDPFRVSFLWEDGWLGTAIEAGVNLIFLVDLLLGFLSAYERNVGMILELVTEPREIVRHYLRGNFFVNFLAIIPLFAPLFFPDNKQRHYNMFRFPLLLLRLPALIEMKMSTWSNSNEVLIYILGDISMNTRDGMARIAKIAMAVLQLTHWVACFWHAIPTSDGVRCADDGDLDWIVLAHMCDASTTEMYVTSVYWAFTTLSTVGFGDIIARTNGEKLFCMLVMLLGVSCYAYILGSVSIVISHFDVSERHEHQRHRQLAKFCNDFHVPMDIRRRLTHNLDFKLHEKHESRDYDLDVVLDDFSPSLRVELISVIHAPLIEKLPYLHGKSLEFVAGVVSQLQTLVAYRGDTIAYMGKIATAMYFVGTGKLEVRLDDAKAVTLVSGQSFGEVGCLIGVVTACVNAIETCELYPLHRESVLNLMAEFPAFELEMKEKALRHVAKRESEEAVSRRGSVSSKPVGEETGVVEVVGGGVVEAAGGGAARARAGAGGVTSASTVPGPAISKFNPLKGPLVTGPPLARVQHTGKPLLQADMFHSLQTFMAETREHQQEMARKMERLTERVDELSARGTKRGTTTPTLSEDIEKFTT